MKIVEAPLADVCEKIRTLLDQAVGENLGEAIFLSGGLDTSIIATIATRYAKPLAFTIALVDSPALDLEYANLMAKRLGLSHRTHVFDYDELRAALTDVVRTLRTFDPMEVRNSATIMVGLKLAQKIGLKSVMTGDAADELLAGYSFLFNLQAQDLRNYLERMWKVMRFSSIPLAQSLGMVAKLPYLHPSFRDYVTTLDLGLLIRKEMDQTFGKWVLRKAFEGQLPSEIIWRTKTAIEFGSGTTILPKLYDGWITGYDLSEKKDRYLKQDGVTIRDKEHLAYYEIFRDVCGPPNPENPNARTCPGCTSNVPEIATFCTTCGAYPI